MPETSEKEWRLVLSGLRSGPVPTAKGYLDCTAVLPDPSPLHSVPRPPPCIWIVRLYRSHPTQGSSSQLAPAGQDPRCSPTRTATRWCPCPRPTVRAKERVGAGEGGDSGLLRPPRTSSQLMLSDVVGRWWAGPCSAIQTEKQAWQPYRSTKKTHRLPDGPGGCAIRG